MKQLIRVLKQIPFVIIFIIIVTIALIADKARSPNVLVVRTTCDHSKLEQRITTLEKKEIINNDMLKDVFKPLDMEFDL